MDNEGNRNMKPTIEINNANFDAEVLQSKLPVVADFWAEWCGPCKMLAPALDEIAVAQAGRFKVVKINVDDNPVLAGRYEIRSVPTLLYFAGGEVRDQIVGLVGKASILSKLDKLGVAA
jgi:thioredoxin 1